MRDMKPSGLTRAVDSSTCMNVVAVGVRAVDPDPHHDGSSTDVSFSPESIGDFGIGISLEADQLFGRWVLKPGPDGVE